MSILWPDTNTILPTLDLIGILTVFWKWLIMLSLALWVGILVIKGIVLNGHEQRSILLARCEKRSQSLQWLCLLVLLTGEVVTLILQAAQFTQSHNGDTLDPAMLDQLLFQSTYGFLWIARIIFILASLGLLCWTTIQPNLRLPGKQTLSVFSRRNDPLTIGWLILAGLLLLTYAFSENVTQSDTQLHMYAIVLGWLSLAAQSTWFGGLAYLGYVLLPLLRMIEPGHRVGTLTALFRRFHPLMLAAIGVLFVSELYFTSISLRNIQQFITDPYGRVLLVKWVLILMMIILSAYALFVLGPKLVWQTAGVSLVNAEGPARRIPELVLDQATRQFRQVLSQQSWLGAAVLLCTALITFFVPPTINESQYAPTGNIPTGTPANTHSTQTKQVGDLSVMLAVTPGVTNVANTVIVTLTDRRSGKPVTNAHIEISTNMELMDMGTVRATMTGGTPTYKVIFAQGKTFSMSGLWDIKLTIQLPNQGPLVVVFRVLFLSSETKMRVTVAFLSLSARGSRLEQEIREKAGRATARGCRATARGCRATARVRPYYAVYDCTA